MLKRYHSWKSLVKVTVVLLIVVITIATMIQASTFTEKISMAQPLPTPPPPPPIEPLQCYYPMPCTAEFLFICQDEGYRGERLDNTCQIACAYAGDGNCDLDNYVPCVYDCINDLCCNVFPN